MWHDESLILLGFCKCFLLGDINVYVSSDHSKTFLHFSQADMSKDALTALHRHFEQQYGKLEFQEARGKKRKRKELRKEPEEKVESDFEDEEEWQGIQDEDDNVEEKPEPEVVIFNDGTQSDDISTMKPSSFMVRNKSTNSYV